jgi:hypothetical protein
MHVEAVGSSKTLVPICHTAQHHNSIDCNLYIRYNYNSDSYIKTVTYRFPYIKLIFTLQVIIQLPKQQEFNTKLSTLNCTSVILVKKIWLNKNRR